MQPQKAYEALIAELKEITTLSSITAVLEWDERTQMPAKGAENRAAQSTVMAKLAHERFTSQKIGEWLATVEGSSILGEADSDVAVNVRETRRAYDRATKLPTKLVEELTHTAVLAQQAWGEAKGKNDYKHFQPWLEKTLELKRQEAACVGNKSGKAYDALLDQFEPDATSEEIQKTFTALRAPLVELVGKIVGSGKKAPIEILERSYSAAGQEKLARDAAKAVGFDFEAGRLDVSLHPFCTSFGPGDTRMTTRYDEKYFGDAFFGVLHETGHALYDQGLPKDHYGTPCGEYVSLGIHESQSRMWENLVGRSKSFWKHFMPKAKETFGATLADVSPEQWYFAINDVRPSFIRTESDEATYNLHIMLRFELEQALLTGDLKPGDLPAAWNERMQNYLGLQPPDDTKGCLQDIHWSGGAIGYFPTYTLGNLFAAQFFEQARKDVGDLDAQFAKGEFAPLLNWLIEKIHRHGKRYSAGQLVQRITGKSLEAEPLLRHLRAKSSELYGV